MWAEKYRPTTLDEIEGHEAIVRTFRSFLKTKDFANIVLYGPPGSGKTALIRAFAKEFYTDNYFKHNFKEINGSDQRKLDDVRQTIKPYSKTGAKGPFKFKILYIGEIDGMTSDAQKALRRVIETSHRTVRFWADCNDPQALIPAIQDRFVPIFAGKLSLQTVANHLVYIAGKEGIDERIESNEVYDQIAQMAAGSLRFAIELLELMPDDDVPITVDFLKQLSPWPTRKEVAKLCKSIFTDGRDTTKQVMLELMNEADLNGMKILEIMYEIFRDQGADKLNGQLPQVLDVIAHSMDMMTKRCNPVIQLEICIERIKQVTGRRK